jgi:hypothetical protein
MFFQADRHNFFRPLSGKRRELVVACLHAMYERLHGPGADHANNMSRDALRDLIAPIIQLTANQLMGDGADGADGSEDDFSKSESTDDKELAGLLIRSLLKDGWLETFGDRISLITVYRFSRAGKLFAEALWVIDRPRVRARQRNMRSCRNALEAALKNADAHDLIDAYDYAEKVISDLSEGADYFHELVRRLMAEASSTPWDGFMEFLDRFEKEFKKQLTSDNVERHRAAIRDTVNRLRGMDDEKADSLEAQLNDSARWAAQEKTSGLTFDWMLDRIEELVEAACSTKQPELIKAMNSYMRRAASIVQQAMMLRSGSKRHAYTTAINQVAALEGDEQTSFLIKLSEGIAAAEVRLLDPASFKLRSLSQRRKALTVTALPKVTRGSRLNAALQRAEAGAFALSNEDVRESLRAELRLRDRPLRLSTLPSKTAADVLHAMQAVEAIRASHDGGIRATKLSTKLLNDYYTASDYLIELTPHAD